jgi:DNA-binding beta-propeller fold protein YncE
VSRIGITLARLVAAGVLALGVAPACAGARGWSAPATIAAGASEAGPRLQAAAVSPNGRAVVAWTFAPSIGSTAYAAYRPPGGRFGARTFLARDAEFLRIAVADRGATFASWMDLGRGRFGALGAAFRPALGVLRPVDFGPVTGPPHAGSWSWSPRYVGFDSAGRAQIIAYSTRGTTAVARGAAGRPPGRARLVSGGLAAVAPDGRFVFVDPGPARPLRTRAIRFATVAGDGRRGPSSRVLATYRCTTDREENVCFSGGQAAGTDRQGRVLAAWAVPLGRGYVVRAALGRIATQRFGAPFQVARFTRSTAAIATTRSHSGLAMNARGDSVLIMTAGGATYAAFRPAGGPHRALERLASGPSYRDQPRAIAIDPVGNAIVVWARADGAVAVSVRQRGSHFGTPRAIGALRPAGGVDLAVDARGRALLAWDGPPGVQAATYSP